MEMVCDDLGEKVVLTLPDLAGAGHDIASALCTQEELPLTWKHVRTSTLQLSLQLYGLADHQVALQIWTFLNKEGIAKVSVIKVPEQIKPHLCACSAHAILKFVMEKAPIHLSSFSLIIPSAAVLPSQLQNDADNSHPSRSIWFSIFNDSVEGKKQEYSKLRELPLTTQIQDELLASLLHLVKILEVQAVIMLVAINRLSPLDSEQAQKEKNRVNEMIHSLGQILENDLGLEFSTKLLAGSRAKIYDQEMSHMGADWRNLYI
ncbi:hypothetical protein O6H91_20G048200 [Diphasiastrum complanatum]|uniref:Uncharacterized protein n=1 Tax=Diphasiastrum complanatum TaxID=34168 RepID=A0ACC2APW3_DIPCM|nr:hypothetical protein O6H91_20G048200 [Diphasiastrum complanatum]